MNIDEHPAIPGQLGIQSIPAVIAFVNGQPVDGFMGALPEGQVTAFLERLTKDRIGGEAQDLLKAADAALVDGDPAGAAELYAAAARRRQHQRACARRAGALLCRNRRASTRREQTLAHGAGEQAQRNRSGRRARGARPRRAGQVGRAVCPNSNRKSPPTRSITRRASISRSRSTAITAAWKRSNT